MEDLLAKIRFLEKEISFETRECLTRDIHHILDSETKNFAKGMKKYLAIDLLYILAKHKLWLKVQFFQQITLSYLSSYFTLPTKTSHFLLQNCISRFILYNKVPDYQMTDNDFISFLVIATISSEEISKLEKELGLGEEILHLIQNATMQQENTPLSPEEGKIIHEIKSISQSCVQKPWFLDTKRLFFILKSHDKNITEEMLEPILSILIKIGPGLHTEDHIQEVYKKFILSNLNFQCFLSLLKSADLIFNEPKYERATKKHNNNWRLTEKAFQLTSFTFALQIKETDLSKVSFSTLPNAWKIAFIKVIENDSVKLQNILQSMQAIDEKVFATTIEKLSQIIDIKSITSIIEQYIEAALPEQTKIAALNTLHDFHLKDSEYFKTIAKEHSHKNIRKIAKQLYTSQVRL